MSLPQNRGAFYNNREKPYVHRHICRLPHT